MWKNMKNVCYFCSMNYYVYELCIVYVFFHAISKKDIALGLVKLM